MEERKFGDGIFETEEREFGDGLLEEAMREEVFGINYREVRLVSDEGLYRFFEYIENKYAERTRFNGIPWRGRSNLRFKVYAA